MRTLATPGVLDAVLGRIAALRAEDTARWGRMNVGQMVCHLRDAATLPLGERAVAPVQFPLPPGVLKFLALYAPMRWQKGFPTLPQFDQLQQGTPPVDFDTDRAALAAMTRRLANARAEGRIHPFFGPLSQTEWMRWAWLHTDHHLRQFGR